MISLKDIVLDPERVVEYLKHEVRLEKILREILSRQVILEAAEQYGVEVSQEEVQKEADDFRYKNKLENSSQTYSWLEDQLITAEEWEEGIRCHMITNKLSEYLFSKKVEEYFAQNIADYEQVVLYKIVVLERALAQEIFYKIEENEMSFFEAAHCYDIQEGRRLTCGYEGKVSRWQLKPAESSKIFSANPNEILEITETENGYELCMVERFISPELTPEIRKTILRKLYKEWIDSELNHYIHSQKLVSENSV